MCFRWYSHCSVSLLMLLQTVWNHPMSFSLASWLKKIHHLSLWKQRTNPWSVSLRTLNDHMECVIPVDHHNKGQDFHYDMTAADHRHTLMTVVLPCKSTVAVQPHPYIWLHFRRTCESQARHWLTDWDQHRRQLRHHRQAKVYIPQLFAPRVGSSQTNWFRDRHDSA